MAGQSPLRSACVSLGFAAWTICAVVLAFAAADGAISTPGMFFGWLGLHWWPVLVGLIVNPGPIYRARQALLNAQKGSL